MTEEDWTRLARTMSALADAPIRIGTPSEFQIKQLCADVTALVRESGLKLLLIDGLEWMTGHNLPANISAEFALWRLKSLAETLKIAVIVTAQAERLHKNLSNQISSQNLKAGDAIDRVADVVIILHRPDQDEPLSPRMGEADLIVVKNRNGQTVTIPVAYQGHYCRFASIVPNENPLFPTIENVRLVGGSASMQQASVHDVQFYRRFIAKLPPNGRVIQWLKANFIAKAVRYDLFHELEEATKDWGLNPVGFDNRESHESFGRLDAAVREFCSTVSWWTWADEGQHWLNVPLDWREDDSERWNEAVDAIVEKRDSLINSYDEFLLTSHRNHLDYDSARR